MKILLTGGGTGGHIIPLLAVVSKLKKLADERKIGKLEFMLIGSDSDFNKNISESGIQIKIIKTGKLRRYFSIENLIDIFRIPIGIVQSLHYIYQFKPDVVFSKGGFASVPPVIAARILRVPILTHESDIVPGLANKIISFFAAEILVSFEDTKKYFPGKKTVFTGSPIREDIFNGNKNRAREIFGLKENIPTVLIFGGSQGARKINEIVLKPLPAVLEKYQVIHVCGMKNYEEINSLKVNKHLFTFKEFAERYKAYPYLDAEMKDAYALADVVISRAGANSLFEIMALEKPSIIIPLPTSASDHQYKNAEFFEKKEMLVLVKEEDLAFEKLVGGLSKLLSEGGVNKIRDNIRRYNNSVGQNAAKSIAEEILKFG